MKHCMVLLTVFAVLSVSTVHAKRAVPIKVQPVIAGQIEYRAPASQMGCVEAWDTKSNELIWRRQLYVVKYNVSLERDVQDVFITTLKLKDNTVVVKNERSSEYELDLDTLQIKVLKGALVETFK